MILKIINQTSQTITGAAIILGAASFVSRLMGMVRDRIFAHQFGAGDVLDAYYAAFRIPDTIYNLLIVGALSAGFIPVFMELLAKDKREAWRVTNSILNILGIGSLLISGILFFLAPAIVSWITPGFSADKMDMTVMLTRIMLASPILLGVSSVVSGVLQSFRSFFLYSLTPILYNIGIIIGAVLFVPLFGISGLAYGVVLGAFLHLAAQIPALRRHGFRYQTIWEFSNSHVKKIGKLMIPRTLGLATQQLNLLAITGIASTLPIGSLAIFNFANNLQYVPVGIIGVSFAIAAFPNLSQSAAEGKKEDMIARLSETIRQILFFIIPITLILLILRAQIVRVVLGSGAFDWNATIATGNALAFFSLSLFAQALIPLLARTFYAMQDTWAPFLVSLIGTLATIIGALHYKETYGIAGLALGYSLGMIAQVSLLWMLLRQKMGTLHEGRMIATFIKISFAGIAMAFTVQLLKTPLAAIVDMTRFWGIFTQGLIAGIAGLLVYCALLHALKLEEMEAFRATLNRRWLKLTNYHGHIDGQNNV